MKSCVFLLVILLLPGVANAAQPTVRIGDFDVYLGMSKDAVMKGLSAKYKIVRVQDSEDWVVFEKGSQSMSLGGVSFQNNKVLSASRTIGDYSGKDSINFMQALHSALDTMSRSGENIIKMKTESQSYGEKKFKSINFYFKKRTLSVSIAYGPDVLESVIIEEHIGWPITDK